MAAPGIDISLKNPFKAASENTSFKTSGNRETTESLVVAGASNTDTLFVRLAEAAGSVRRSALRKPFPSGNVAVAEMYLSDGTSFGLSATSKAKGMLPEIPKSRSIGGLFEPTWDIHSKRLMETDSEFKIYDAVGGQLQAFPAQQRAGTLYLYTERSQCGSCVGVQQQFESMFPDISVIVRSTYPWRE